MEYETLLSTIPVCEVRGLLIENPLVINAEASVDALLAKMIEDPRTRHVYVVNDEGVLIGSVRMHRIVERFFPFTMVLERGQDSLCVPALPFAADKVSEIMKSEPFYVHEDTALTDVARILMREHINELPVVDWSMRLIGQINMHEIITAYLQRVPITGAVR